MGSHTNYYRLIDLLVSLKHEFYRIDNPKYQGIIGELEKYDYNLYKMKTNSLPDVQNLVNVLGLKKVKVQQLLKGLHQELIDSFSTDRPLEIKNICLTIHVTIPYDEIWKAQNPDYKNFVFENASTIHLRLPFIPRIGEIIDLKAFFNNAFFKGTVHEIHHNINGCYHEIEIWVHPFKNYYHQWKKIETEYDNYQRNYSS